MKNNDTNAERKEPILTFDHTFKVEVYEPDFEPLSSTNSLDEKKLSTGNHTIEFGYMNLKKSVERSYRMKIHPAQFSE